jgi:hypothetical protein
MPTYRSLVLPLLLSFAVAVPAAQAQTETALVKSGRIRLVTYDQLIARSGGPQGTRPVP